MFVYIQYLHLNCHGFDLQYVLPCFSRVDPDSTLHRDLMQLKGQEGTDHVLLNMTFTVSEVIHLKKTDAGVSVI